MKENFPFLALVPSFNFGDDALLLLADHSTIVWLMSRFEALARIPVELRSAAFVIGDGKPVQSDGQCTIVVESTHHAKGSELIRKSESTFRWILSPGSADRYRDLLSVMSDSVFPCHQYLDPDNASHAPVVIVSLGEYQVDAFRRQKA